MWCSRWRRNFLSVKTSLKWFNSHTKMVLQVEDASSIKPENKLKS